MAENIEPGSRVRVTYEGDYVRADGLGHHLIGVGFAIERYFMAHAPSGAMIEVIRAPAPDEPKGLGAVVRIDGSLAVRADTDGPPWYTVADGQWLRWHGLIEGTKSVKVESPGVEVSE